MTTARQLITDALTFHLNRLSPGETLEADTAALCLSALNSVVDEWSAGQTLLFREVLTAAAVTGTVGTLGTTWPTVAAGTEVLGATVLEGGKDVPLNPLTLRQYQEQIASKAQTGSPEFFAPDGFASLYFWPAATGQTVTLRTMQPVSDFADLDTVYALPKGYRSALSACLAERVATVLVGGVPGPVAMAAGAARRRIGNANAKPAIVGSASVSGDILSGWH